MATTEQSSAGFAMLPAQTQDGCANEKMPKLDAGAAVILREKGNFRRLAIGVCPAMSRFSRTGASNERPLLGVQLTKTAITSNACPRVDVDDKPSKRRGRL